MATYRVGADGKAQKGLKTGDKVVTAGGTYTITGVNSDGSYKSTKTSNQTSITTGEFRQADQRASTPVTTGGFKQADYNSYPNVTPTTPTTTISTPTTTPTTTTTTPKTTTPTQQTAITYDPATNVEPTWIGNGTRSHEPTPEVDITAMMNELLAAQRQQRIAALGKARDTALGTLDSEKSTIEPYYYDKRNQAAAQSDIQSMNFAQFMASRGIRGNAAAMPEIYRNAGLQNQLGQLNRSEAADLADIERRRSGINTAYESDVVAANADIDAQSLQAFINQMNADRTFNAAQRQAEFDRQMKEWSVNPNNPEVQATILANKKRELDLVAQEIQNSYLPDTLKLEAQRLQQQVTAGYLDIDIARAKLEQIKNNPVDINDIIRQIDSLYVYKDPNSGENRINTNGLRAYILSLNLPDTQTDQLLMRYGI